MATWKQIRDMRELGFDVGENLTKDRVAVLKKIHNARTKYGIEIDERASAAEIDKALAMRPFKFKASVWPDDFRCDIKAGDPVWLELSPIPSDSKRIIVTDQTCVAVGKLSNWGVQRYYPADLAKHIAINGRFEAVVSELRTMPPDQYRPERAGAILEITVFPADPTPNKKSSSGVSSPTVGTARPIKSTESSELAHGEVEV